jgi:hypothetical protein
MIKITIAHISFLKLLRANVRVSETPLVLVTLPPLEFARGRSHQPGWAF